MKIKLSALMMLSLGIFLICLEACKKSITIGPTPANVDITWTVAGGKFTFRGLGKSGPLTIDSVMVPGKLDSFVKAKGYALTDIVSCTINSVNARITTPSFQRFDKFSNMSVYLNAKGQSPLQVASLPNVPKNASQVDYSSFSSTDLRNYLTADSVRVTANATASDTIANSFKMDLTLRYKITFKGQ